MTSASGFKSSLTGLKANRWLSDLTEELGGNFAEFASHIGFTESQVKVIQETGQHLRQLVISKCLDTIGLPTAQYQNVVYIALVTLKQHDLLDKHFKGGNEQEETVNEKVKEKDNEKLLFEDDTTLPGNMQIVPSAGNLYDTKVLGYSKRILFQAVKCGDIRKLENCIEYKIDFGSKSTNGRVVLHIAVAYKQYKFVHYLLNERLHCIKKGADLDIQGLNALHICFRNGDAEVYCLLQKTGFDTGITTNNGKTVLDLAKEKHHNHHLDFIGMTQNIEVKGIHWSTWTELHHCAVSGSEAECSRLIEDFPKDVNVEVDTEKYLAGIRTISTKNIFVRGILTQLLEKHEDVQYGKLIATGENVLVIYTTDQLDDTCSKIAGIKTIYKNINGFDQDNERAIDFELDMGVTGLSKEENAQMKDVVDANSDTLWKNHKNLNGIRISAVRTTGGKAYRDNCIVLCCKFKGFLTQKEEEFPRFLRCKGIFFPVDVREEHIVILTSQPSDKLEPLACGGLITGISADNKVCGTIGPFVALPNQETGFLTCAHVLDNRPDVGVQSGRNHLVYQPKKDSNEDSPCGEVVKMVFKPSADPSIDAAVVKITSALRIPGSINFVSFKQDAFLAAGIAEGLTFNTGTIGVCQPTSPVLKFGAFTSDLKCFCSAIGHEERVKYPHGNFLMKGLTKILCRADHQHGDSGAGVFVKNAEDKLECVGLFFAGRGREGYFIPIKDVLAQCGGYDLKV